MSSKFAEVGPKGGRGKKRKLAEAKAAAERQLPADKAVARLPASALYTTLCDFESKVDALEAGNLYPVPPDHEGPSPSTRSPESWILNPKP